MNAQEHFQKGVDKINENDFVTAIEHLTKAIDEKSDDPFFYNHRAIAYMNQNEYDLAMFDMNKSIDLDGNYAYFYSCRGFLKARLRDAEGAIADYEESLKLDPHNEITYNNLGLVLEQMGSAQKAKKMYDKGNEILGYDPEKRNLENDEEESKTTSPTSISPLADEETTPLDKKSAKKERKKLAKEVLSSKLAFKEFLGFIGNGFKLKGNDKKGKS